MTTQQLMTALKQAAYALEVANVDARALQQTIKDNAGQISIETNKAGDFRLFDPHQLSAYPAPRDGNGWTAWALTGE